ncbi:gliding motility lipoprotein GldB [Ekhidna sp. To15]|uniref:gliding motility lipoprotein GldB n=1 Tax=Ekhidna sp. To15 TaxID=3395267 RepID=UPI003F52813F
MRVVLLMICVVFFASCASEPCRDSVQPESIVLEVDRLEQELFSRKSVEEVEGFLESHPDFAKFFLHSDQYPTNTILAERMFGLIQNPSIDTLYQESVEAFKNFDEVVNTLEEGLGRLKTYYPQTPSPRVQTAVTGLYNDLFISNEHIMIGMDFFIGEGASYKPQQIPNYILARYTTQHLAASILQFVSSQYIQTGRGDQMLSEMIDYGKSYYLLSKILPCTPERILIGYTEDEWEDVFENDQIIWANFVQNEWLYETNHTVKQKFLGERPNVYEIGDKCPGRIGRWLGWQIVNAYAEKTGASVTEIMAETDLNKLFTQSGYKPSGS